MSIKDDLIGCDGDPQGTQDQTCDVGINNAASPLTDHLKWSLNCSLGPLCLLMAEFQKCNNMHLAVACGMEVKLQLQGQRRRWGENKIEHSRVEDDVPLVIVLKMTYRLTLKENVQFYGHK